MRARCEPSYRARMDLPLSSTLTYGVITTVVSVEDARAIAERSEAQGWDSLWVGDHVAFTVPIYDPLLQLGILGAYSKKLRLGTSVYLLPLRHPVPAAKQVATLDRMLGGRLEFGVGVGGEFANEYRACGVPLNERGARLSEGIELLRKLWSGESVTHAGRFYPLENVRMLPTPAQRPLPVYCGGRSDGALARIGRLADGWISYVVTAEQYRAGLEKIAAEAARAQRKLARFHTGHLLLRSSATATRKRSRPRPIISRAATRWTSAKLRSATPRSASPRTWPRASPSFIARACATSSSIWSAGPRSARSSSRASRPKCAHC